MSFCSFASAEEITEALRETKGRTGEEKCWKESSEERCEVKSKSLSSGVGGSFGGNKEERCSVLDVKAV